MPRPSKTCAFGASSKAAYYSLSACYWRTFWQPCLVRNINVTSHTKMFLMVCRFRTDSKCACRTLAVWMNWASVQTAQAIHAKKICIHSHSSGYPCEKNLHPFEWLMGYLWEKRCHPFKKIVISSNSSSYLFKTVIIVSRGFDFTWAVRNLVARAGVTWQTCQKCK